jgi:hypothetical protein
MSSSFIFSQSKINISGFVYDEYAYLSYHKREYSFYLKMPDNVKRILVQTGKKPKQYVPAAYRHEVFVLNLANYSKNLKSKS